jgi:hypothetical protein
MLEYKYKNKKEIEIIEKYFKSDFTSGDSVYYTITIKTLRKAKLFILTGGELAEKLKYIINNSKTADVYSLLERKLSEEIAKEIDKKIISNLIKEFGQPK